jgi:hypothetical protein
MDTVLVVMFRLLEAMFVIGLAGCVVVIPVAAYRMFSVLFEKDESNLMPRE